VSCAGQMLQRLAASAMLSKGLARAGINDFDHQRQIAAAVVQLNQLSPEQLAEEMLDRVQAREYTDTCARFEATRQPKKDCPHPVQRPRQDQRFVVPVLPRLSRPCPPADVRHDAQREAELVKYSRWTPRPWSDDPADGEPSLLDKASLGSVRQLRARLVKSRPEYKAALQFSAALQPAVANVRGVQQLHAQREAQDMMLLQREGAATRIQAAQRGFVGRKAVEELRTARNAALLQAEARPEPQVVIVNDGVALATDRPAAQKDQQDYEEEGLYRNGDEQEQAYNEEALDKDEQVGRAYDEEGLYEDEQEHRAYGEEGFSEDEGFAESEAG